MSARRFRRWGSQVDPQRREILLKLIRRHRPQEIGDQIVLPRLPKRHPVHDQRPAECSELFDLATQRQRGYVALDRGTVGKGVDPERHEIGRLSASLFNRRIEQRLPWVGVRTCCVATFFRTA